MYVRWGLGVYHSTGWHYATETFGYNEGNTVTSTSGWGNSLGSQATGFYAVTPNAFNGSGPAQGVFLSVKLT